ncbi:MAG: N-acetyl-gamma-glutamyl-phosphate reductase [Pseudomonadales bacterium]|nr:N-acetyl-gamma-glutamyl-phosphate reductase [Pseudomonadales bacterium]
MSFSIFIDGQAGTTGLQIVSRLSERSDIELINIDEKHRKSRTHRSQCYAQSDLVILCLPDEASILALQELADPDTRILDASTAFRTHPDWVYGLPELNSAQSSHISNSKRVANPGCYSTGYILSVRPLYEAGLIAPDTVLSVYGLSGYSGGGNQAIQQWENSNLPTQPYALGLCHKHLPEMQHYSGSRISPIFTPSIANYHAGMIVQTHLAHALCGPGFSQNTVYEAWSQYYEDSPFIKVHRANDYASLNEGKLSPTSRNDTNYLDLFVFGNDDQSVLLARYDNLGKGASGAAVQNLNLMLGLKETTGLENLHAHG